MGFFKKLITGKESSCCSIKIEEVKDEKGVCCDKNDQKQEFCNDKSN